MTRPRPLHGLAIGCALLALAVFAQSASAATAGQTVFECTQSATTKTFSDAHCDNTTGTAAYGHVVLPQGEQVAATVSNEGTKNNTEQAVEAVGKIALLKGFKNVTIECRNVEGAVDVTNILAGEVHRGTGTSAIRFNDGGGANCRTSQAGCTVKVSELQGQAVTVEGLAPGGTGMGLEFKPLAGAAKFGTVKWEGACGLAAFPLGFPIEGSAIATANGQPNGRGATAVFGANNNLTIGGSALEFTATLTFKKNTGQKALVLTTPPFLNDA
jgi:hypothetical protein